MILLTCPKLLQCINRIIDDEEIIFSIRTSTKRIDTSLITIQEHCQLEERLALRIIIAEKMINGRTIEEKKEQFSSFQKQMENSIQDLDKPLQDDLRSAFLKAAHHRMDPLKHLGKHMLKAIQ